MSTPIETKEQIINEAGSVAKVGGLAELVEKTHQELEEPLQRKVIQTLRRFLDGTPIDELIRNLPSPPKDSIAVKSIWDAFGSPEDGVAAARRTGIKGLAILPPRKDEKMVRIYWLTDLGSNSAASFYLGLNLCRSLKDIYEESANFRNIFPIDYHPNEPEYASILTVTQPAMPRMFQLDISR